ncbi:MAG: hypothetical protein J1F11_10320 [Oscillospiraceae bacterium]|nr:hypothetical protein [Oscillospiraceae bacterium]
MNFGITGMVGGVYASDLYKKIRSAGAADKTGFLDAIAAKAAEQTENVSFEEMLRSKYRGVYFNVMDTSRISDDWWGRNDYPRDKFFSEPADESALDWQPDGAEPPMSNPEIQKKISATLGKTAVVIPPELEEKMKNDPELAKQVMNRIDSFIARHYSAGANQGFLMIFDENGEISQSCVTGEGFSVSSSEFADARKAREKKQAEYDRIAEENALKRRLLEQIIEHRHLQSDIIYDLISNTAVSSAKEELI